MTTSTKPAALLIKRAIYGGIAALLVAMTPAPYVFAGGVVPSTPTTSTCSPVTPAPTGPQQPTGSDAGTYTYNSCTGLWENPHYTWSPATQTASPKSPYVYSCNTSTWKWSYKQWVYIASSSSFEQQTVTVAQPPAGAPIDPNSPTVCAPAPVASANSSNTINGTVTNNTSINNSTGTSITNQIDSTALSGNATVANAGTGGDAKSGDASAVLSLANTVNSSSVLAGGQVVTFVANITGNVQGDLLIDPSLLQPASGSGTLNSANNLAVNNQTNNNITNNINLNAKSGDATVANDKTGGDATSGNATAIANIVNTLNSVIHAGQSFIGTININGNLNGNILMPQSFLDQLIASNAPSSTVTISQQQANNLGITTTNNQTITNNVTSTATSGDTTVSNNGTGGDAKSGDASTATNTSTKLTVFNITGNQIIAANSLLVFVNVSGKWVGVIMNAPAGSTAAAFGGGITTNSVNNADINATNNGTITNNINVAAASGDATVSNNGTGGDAKSGNASTEVNLLNLDNSQFDLTGWFGVLFINITGDWIGSFGAAPSPTDSAAPGRGGSTDDTAGANAPHDGDVRVFQFAPTPSSASGTNTSTGGTLPTAGVNTQLTSKTSQVLGAVSHVSDGAQAMSAATARSVNQLQVMGSILVLLGASVVIAERFMSNRQFGKALFQKIVIRR